MGMERHCKFLGMYTVSNTLGSMQSDKGTYYHQKCLNIPSVYPSWLQTTLASLLSQLSSHTVPQLPWRHTSTRPWYWLSPFTSRISPFVQLASTSVDQSETGEIYTMFQNAGIYNMYTHTVEPPNNGHVWDQQSVLYRDFVLSLEVMSY